MTICAVTSALFIAPRVRERAVIDWLHGKEAEIAYEAEGPEWLRRLAGDKFFQRVVGVKIVEQPVAQSDLSRFDALPRLRTLHLTGSVLHHILNPRITSSLSNLSVADAEEFADRRPEVDFDLAFAESLYRASAQEYQTSAVPFREVLFACQTAARWKIACAQYKVDAGATVAAYKQLLDWLEEIASRVGGDAAALPTDVPLARCAIKNAKLALYRAQRDESAGRAACNEGSAVAAELVQMTDPTDGSGPIDPCQFDIAWSNAIELLLAKARVDGDKDAELLVLKQQVDAFSGLAAKIGVLYTAGERGGESEKFDLARIDLALAEARLAGARGDHDAERRTLHDALPMAAHLRQAIKAAYEVGVITVTDLLYSDGRATELETAAAQAKGDADTKRSMEQAHAAFLAQIWRKRAGRICGLGAGPLSDDERIGCLLRCLLAIHRLEREGRTAFADCVSPFAPRMESLDTRSDGDEMPGATPDDWPNDEPEMPVLADEPAPPAHDDIEAPPPPERL
ncbi:MAG TPA: hypothetical protein VG125_24860 [Pirellulales bacterium]|nr:hypothetical protein [Pirellulales bacterium]